MAEQTVLQEAHDLIYGERQEQYGHPRVNLQNIADMWGVYFHGKYQVDFPLTPVDVCQLMALLKMCRGFGSDKRDSIVDQAGYIGLIERVM